MIMYQTIDCLFYGKVCEEEKISGQDSLLTQKQDASWNKGDTVNIQITAWKLSNVTMNHERQKVEIGRYVDLD